MKSDSGRRWLIAAVGLFLLLLVGWVLLALQLNIALAGPLPFAPRLRSNLPADYRADDGSVPIGMISLSIDEAVQALRQSLGLTDEEAAAQRASLELAMSQPVPTATALNFSGDTPFTSTPTKTPLPTDTPTPLPTNTRPPAISTSTATKTKEPTDKPEATEAATGEPTAEPTAAGDTEDPKVEDFSVSPSPGTLPEGVCTITAEVEITDAGPSSGIDYVRLKYENPVSGPDYIYSDDFVLVSEEPDGFGGWIATYSGSITFTGIDIALIPGGVLKVARPALTSLESDVWFIVKDMAGNITYYKIGEYQLKYDCL